MVRGPNALKLLGCIEMSGPAASGPECRYEKLGCFEIGHPVQAEIAKNQKSIEFLCVLDKLDGPEASGPVTAEQNCKFF